MAMVAEDLAEEGECDCFHGWIYNHAALGMVGWNFTICRVQIGAYKTRHPFLHADAGIDDQRAVFDLFLELAGKLSCDHGRRIERLAHDELIRLAFEGRGDHK